MAQTNPADFAYYPSMVVQLRVNFDEEYLGLLAGGSYPDPLTEEIMATAPPPAPPEKPGLRNDYLGGSSTPTVRISNRQPKTASVELPGYRQAGKFQMTIPYRDLPIDPRLVRAAAVEIYLGCVSPSAFAAGQGGATTDGHRSSVLTPRYILDGQQVVSDSNILMVGVVDNWAVEHGSPASMATLEGRDPRSILLDSPINVKALSKLNLDQPIDKVVQDIISKHPFGRVMIIKTHPQDWVDLNGNVIPLPRPLAEKNATRVLLGPTGTEKPNAPPKGESSQINFWDLITNYCALVGAVPTFIGDILWIRPARSLFDQNKVQDFDPQFGTFTKPRIVDGKQRVFRLQAYGKDIETLKFERKYKGNKPRIVQVFSLDTGSSLRGAQKLLSAQYPPDLQIVKAKNGKKGRVTARSPGGELAASEVIKVYKNGIKDKGKLLEIAKDVFEEIARGEMGGCCVTKNLASFGGNNSDPDLLHIRPGNPIELATAINAVTDGPPLVNEFIDHERRSVKEEVQAIAAQTGSLELAKVLVATARGAVPEMLRPFRVSNVKYDYDSNKVNVAFDFQNYVVPRYDPQLDTPKSDTSVKPTVTVAQGVTSA